MRGRRLFYVLAGIAVTALVVLTIGLLAPSLFQRNQVPGSAPVNANTDTVILKDGRPITGIIVKQEYPKFVVIQVGHNQREAIAWEEISSIVQTNPPWSSRFDGWVEWIDLTSKLTVPASIFAGIIVFGVGFWQYLQTQKWKRAEFLAAAVNEFVTHTGVHNAKLMLDSLRIYPEGRMIKLYPDFAEPSQRSVKVTNEDIYNALGVGMEKTTEPDENEREKKRAIADCFDAFFNRLERFDSYINSRLVTKEEVRLHLITWVGLLGGDSVKGKYRQRLWDYAAFYEFVGVESLLAKYNYTITSKYHSAEARLQIDAAPQTEVLSHTKTEEKPESFTNSEAETNTPPTQNN